MFGAVRRAYAAAGTFLVIDESYAVFKGNGAERAVSYAGSEPETAVTARFIASAEFYGGVAVGLAFILIFDFCKLRRAAANDLSPHSDGFFCFNAENFGYGGGGFSAADGAGIRRSFAFCYFLCESFAAGTSASSAVCAGQSFFDFFNRFIFFDFKNLVCDREKHAAEKAEADEPQYGYQYFHNTPII